MPVLRITTDLDESDWQEAAKARWSKACNVRCDVLLANVTIQVDQLQFVSSLGLALADFAFGLARIVREIECLVEGDMFVAELCDSFILRYTWGPTDIRVSHNLSDAEVTLPKDDFLDGVRSFLRWFAATGADRVPAFLEWDELRELS